MLFTTPGHCPLPSPRCELEPQHDGQRHHDADHGECLNGGDDAADFEEEVTGERGLRASGDEGGVDVLDRLEEGDGDIRPSAG